MMDARVRYLFPDRGVSSKGGVEVTVEVEPLLPGHAALQGGVLLLQGPRGVQGEQGGQRGVQGDVGNQTCMAAQQLHHK